MANKKEPIAWITVKGVRVPIFEGQSKEDAFKSFKERIGKRNSNQPTTQAEKKRVLKEYTNARNAAHNAKPDKQEKAGERFEKAKQKYSESKEKAGIKSVQVSKKTGENTVTKSNDVLKTAQDYVSHHLASGEQFAKVTNAEIVGKVDKNGMANVKVDYETRVRVATGYDPETQRMEYEDDTEYHTDTFKMKVGQGAPNESKTKENGDVANKTNDEFMRRENERYEREHGKGTYQKEEAQKQQRIEQARKASSKEWDEKERQIARSRAEADERNGKTKVGETSGQYDKYKSGYKYENAKTVDVNGNEYKVWSNDIYRGTFAEDKNGNVLPIKQNGYLSNEVSQRKAIANAFGESSFRSKAVKETSSNQFTASPAEQAYMNAKAIKISKNMPKEKQEALKKQKAEYMAEYKRLINKK